MNEVIEMPLSVVELSDEERAEAQPLIARAAQAKISLAEVYMQVEAEKARLEGLLARLRAETAVATKVLDDHLNVLVRVHKVDPAKFSFDLDQMTFVRR